MSADIYRKLTVVEELERQVKYLEKCPDTVTILGTVPSRRRSMDLLNSEPHICWYEEVDKFVYRKPEGIALYFREPVVLARVETRKQLRDSKEKVSGFY
ncbi:hypothetical protein COOONC_16278 [Cooperia oncophora]